MDILYIIIPAYNETANIEQVIDEWYPMVERHNGGGQSCGMSRLVIIDGGSSDDTYLKVCKSAETRPLLLPLSKSNSGHGATVLYGYHHALDSGADYIFQTDSDGQTLPEEFERFWRLRDRYDMIIGWRRKQQDGLSRLFVTKILKLVIRLRFHVKVQDANPPFGL